MIDWGQTPVGAVAHIYWPQVKASKVLNLADRTFGRRRLTASDGHTIDCVIAGGITKETLALTAVCLLSPASLIGFSAAVAVRTLTPSLTLFRHLP
jgi:hypothetical protein